MQVHGPVQHQPVRLDGAHAGHELAQVLAGLRGAHGLPLPQQAVGGQSALEGLAGIRGEAAADPAQGGPAQVRPPVENGVQPTTQVAHHVLHVVGVLEPAFDLEAAQAGVGQLLQRAGQVQVADAQQVLVAQQHPAGSVHQVPGGAAGLGAFPAVAAAPADGPAQVAVPAFPHAERAEHEAFQFQAGGGVDGRDLGQAQLPGQDGPAEPAAGQEGHLGRAVAGGLGAGVQGQGRQVQFQVGHVLDDQGVHPGRVQLPGHAPGVLQLPVVQHGVEGGVHLRPPQPGLPGEPLEIGRAASGRLARPEPGAAHVHRVRSAAQREHSLVRVPGGGEQFKTHPSRVPANPPGDETAWRGRLLLLLPSGWS